MRDMEQANAEAYAARHGQRLAERLGFGVHGTVYVVEHGGKEDRSAIKAHKEREFHERERAAYERLREAGVHEVLGFHVPQLLNADGDLWVIEMTIVTRPCVLDFAGAYLDARPEFSEEIWDDWEAQKREQFGERWVEVQKVLGALEEWGIYMVDVSPSNVRCGV